MTGGLIPTSFSAAMRKSRELSTALLQWALAPLVLARRESLQTRQMLGLALAHQ